MKKVVSIAVAALVLSVGGAFAEPPDTAAAGDYPSAGNRGLEQLSDAEMVAVMGEGWWSGVCTVGIMTGGYVVAAVGVISQHPAGPAFGLAIVAVAPAVCA